MFRAKRLIRPAFDCHLGIGAEVDEEPEFATRKFEVIVDLCEVFVSQLIHNLKLYDDLAVTPQIGRRPRREPDAPPSR